MPTPEERKRLSRLVKKNAPEIERRIREEEPVDFDTEDTKGIRDLIEEERINTLQKNLGGAETSLPKPSDSYLFEPVYWDNCPLSKLVTEVEDVAEEYPALRRATIPVLKKLRGGVRPPFPGWTK